MVHSTFLIDLRKEASQNLIFYPPHPDYTWAFDDIIVFAFACRQAGKSNCSQGRLLVWSHSSALGWCLAESSCLPLYSCLASLKTCIVMTTKVKFVILGIYRDALQIIVQGTITCFPKPTTRSIHSCSRAQWQLCTVLGTCIGTKWFSAPWEGVGKALHAPVEASCPHIGPCYSSHCHCNWSVRGQLTY